MANFSVSEIGLINAQRVPEPDRPVYFDARQKIELPISSDFEAYLILQSMEQKQKIQKWVTFASGVEKDNTDRDELLTTFLSNRTIDSTARMEEIDEVLDNFEQMKAELLSDGEDPTRFAEIVEVNVLARSLQRSVDEIAIFRENAFHEITMANIVSKRLESTKTDENTQKELESWQDVVSFYQGQQTSSGGLGGLF